ncbi:MAG: helix-turn-helix domain-containing protein [Cyclobacteriaceae bacterium]
MQEEGNSSFIEQARSIVFDNLKNEQFGVVDLSDKMNLSRSQLHRKIKLKTGKSVSQFIRDVRLEEAIKLLRADSQTVSEVAYKVGFSSSTYFNRCFRQVYGIAPGEVRKQSPDVSFVTANGVEIPAARKTRPVSLRLITILVFITIVMGIFTYFILNGTEGKPRSIAVLPLHNFTGDEDQEYFVKGFHDALIGALGQISSLRVISRTSTLRYSDESNLPPIQEIARELGVEALIEGSVMGTGEQIRIQLQLIKAFPEEDHLWAKEYQRDWPNIIVLQNEIIKTIADEIQVNLTSREEAILNQDQQVNPEAYKAYLRGRFHWDRLTEQDLDLAMQFFEQSRALDPDYPLAYAGIAQTWIGRLQQGLTSFSDSYAEVQLATLKSKVLQLDNIPAEVHFLFAAKNTWVDWNFDAAGVEFEKCIGINPNYSAARAYYCHYLDIVHRPDEASKQIELSLELDPFNPLYKALYGMHLVFSREYDKAIELLLKTLKDSPTDPVALSTLRTAYHLKGKYQEALETWKLSYYAKGDQAAIEALNRGEYQGGYTGALLQLAELLIERSETSYVTPWQIGTIYTRAGEVDLAVEWLQKAYEAHDNNMPYIGVDPIFDVLHQSQGFLNLLDQMGLKSTTNR